MEKTLQAILTDIDSRSIESVETQIIEETSVGAPWFNQETQ